MVVLSKWVAKSVNTELDHLSILISQENSMWPGMGFWEVGPNSSFVGNYTDWIPLHKHYCLGSGSQE